MIAAWVNGRSLRILIDLLGRAYDEFGECADPRHLVDRLAVELHARVPSCITQRGVSLWPMHRTVRPDEQ